MYIHFVSPFFPTVLSIQDAARKTMEIGKFLSLFTQTLSLVYSKLHLIAFSLGAHIAGYAGHHSKKRGNEIGRITGKVLFELVGQSETGAV